MACPGRLGCTRVCTNIPGSTWVTRAHPPGYSRRTRGYPSVCGYTEYTRLCSSICGDAEIREDTYIRINQSTPKYTRVHQGVPKCARACQVTPKFTRVDSSIPEYTPKACQCGSSPWSPVVRLLGHEHLHLVATGEVVSGQRPPKRKWQPLSQNSPQS